jgi:hypothetical protein
LIECTTTAALDATAFTINREQKESSTNFLSIDAGRLKIFGPNNVKVMWRIPQQCWDIHRLDCHRPAALRNIDRENFALSPGIVAGQKKCCPVGSSMSIQSGYPSEGNPQLLSHRYFIYGECVG